ncbi:hypothetical protein OWR29_47860, partial [Actinoplanes sp. Pm04-4]|nr:hypothetical protein [Actinoplanes pyxinae]
AERSSVTCGTALLVAGDPRNLVTDSDRPGIQPKLSRLLTRAHEALAVGPLQSPSFTGHVLPVRGAGRHGREIVTRACVAWKLVQHIDVAKVIVSELISHTVSHASTMMSVTALLYRETVYLWVRGGTRWDVTPTFDTATNLSLLILHAVADHWGVMDDHNDTVIWAALPVR